MNNPIVSIACLTFNHSRYIEEALNSFIEQKTKFPIEIVVFDGGSNDNNREILKHYSNLFIDLFKNIFPEKDPGIPQSVFNLIQSCSGKYVAFCEGDDYWIDSLKLQKQVDFLETHTDYAMVFTHKKTLIGNKFYSQNLDHISIGKIFEQLLIDNYIFTPTVMVKSEIIKKAISKVLTNAEKFRWKMIDYPMWLEVSKENKIGFINDITAVYRMLPESASQSSNPVKTYTFAKSYMNIKENYYEEYLKSNKAKWKYKMDFKEMCFHKKKRLVLDYGFIAQHELFSLLSTNPIFYFYLIYKKCQRIVSKRPMKL